MVDSLIAFIALWLAWSYSNPMRAHNPLGQLKVFLIVSIGLYLTLSALAQFAAHAIASYFAEIPLVTVAIGIVVLVLLGIGVLLYKQGWFPGADASRFDW